MMHASNRPVSYSHRAIALCLAAALCGCQYLREADPADRQMERDQMMAALRNQEKQAAEEKPMTFAEAMTEGDQFLRAGNNDKAVLRYLRAMRLDGRDETPRLRVGFMHLQASDAELAEAAFLSALEREPRSAAGHTGLGLARMMTRDVTGARSALERARELAPDSLAPVLALGVLADLEGDHARARTQYARALEIDRSNAQIEANLGASYLLTEEWSDAASHFTRALQLDPDDPANHNNLGIALARQGRYDEAYGRFKEGGSEASALNNLGYMYYLNGNYERAIDVLERALGSNPPERLAIIRNLQRAYDARDDRASTARRPLGP